MMGVIAHRRIWPCKDGHVCFFVAGGAALGARISSELVTKWANEEGFARAIKDMDWSEFDYALMSKEQWDTIENAFQSFLNTKTKAELFKEAVAKSLMICPVNMAKDVLGCPQLSARDYWARVEHEELGDTITYPEAPVKMAEAPWRIGRRAPLIGEHNEEIYVSELGFTAEQLVTMKACRII